MIFQLDNKMEAVMKLDGVTFILTLYLCDTWRNISQKYITTVFLIR